MTGPLADASASLIDDVCHLGLLIACWAQRDNANDPAAAIRAGRHAIGLIDELLRQLCDARAALVEETYRDQEPPPGFSTHTAGTPCLMGIPAAPG